MPSVECLMGDKDFHMKVTRNEVLAAAQAGTLALKQAVAELVDATSPLSAVMQRSTRARLRASAT